MVSFDQLHSSLTCSLCELTAAEPCSALAKLIYLFKIPGRVAVQGGQEPSGLSKLVNLGTCSLGSLLVRMSFSLMT